MDAVMIPLIHLSAALGGLALGFGLLVFQPPRPSSPSCRGVTSTAATLSPAPSAQSASTAAHPPSALGCKS